MKHEKIRKRGPNCNMDNAETAFLGPFRNQAVTSSFAVANGLIDLKRAAAFYDRIVIIEADVFEPTMMEALGPDLEYLQENDLIKVLPVTEYPSILEGQPGHEYADRIRNGLAAALFSGPDIRKQSHEACGNGFARLQAAVMQTANPGEHFTPIVTSRKRVASLGKAAQFYNEDPLPGDNELEALLPVRSTAARIVFDRLPIPSHDTPWQDILDLRADPGTELYARRLRIMLERLSKETNRRHVEDLIYSEFDDFEQQLKAFKGKKRRATVRWVLPWADKLNALVRSIALLKPSEAIEPHIKANEEVATLNAAEAELKRNPYYLIEHVRTRLA